MKDPEFDAAYREANRAASQAIARMHQMSSAAVSTLGKVMVEPATPAATKVRAADCIINHITKAIPDLFKRLRVIGATPSSSHYAVRRGLSDPNRSVGF